MLFELYDIRFDSSYRILFPVYDNLNQPKLQEVVHLNAEDFKCENSIRKDFVYGQDALLKLNNSKTKIKELYITDSLINMLTLNQELKKPAIVINSTNSIDFKVNSPSQII